MALTKKEKARLDALEHGVGILIGFALGGPLGASMGNTAVAAHQLSPVNNWMKDALFSTLPNRDFGNPLLPNPMPSPTEWLPTGNDLSGIRQLGAKVPTKKRRASAYSKRYGKCFKRLAPKYKKKSGGWKKDGFKRCAKAARKCAKK